VSDLVRNIRLRSTSASETRIIASLIASELRPGDVLMLTGDLGTGKTTFAQGLASALGVEVPVTSPTFTLVNHYSGHIDLIHADLYRLQSYQEVVDLGIEELLDGYGISGQHQDGNIAVIGAIEWGEAFIPMFRGEYFVITLIFGKETEERTISIEASGELTAARLTDMHRKLANFEIAGSA